MAYETKDLIYLHPGRPGEGLKVVRTVPPSLIVTQHPDNASPMKNVLNARGLRKDGRVLDIIRLLNKEKIEQDDFVIKAGRNGEEREAICSLIEDEENVNKRSKQNENFPAFGLHEVMIDFEGKDTAYGMPLWVLEELIKNKKIRKVPGLDFFITPRIPNTEEESIFRQQQVIIAIYSANYFAHQYVKKTLEKQKTETCDFCEEEFTSRNQFQKLCSEICKLCDTSMGERHACIQAISRLNGSLIDRSLFEQMNSRKKLGSSTVEILEKKYCAGKKIKDAIKSISVNDLKKLNRELIEIRFGAPKLTERKKMPEIAKKIQPIFELILPMCQESSQLVRVIELIDKIYEGFGDKYHEKYKDGSNPKNFYVIPLIEGLFELINIRTIVEPYLKYYFSRMNEYDAVRRTYRTFIGRSDPAISAGLVAASLAARYAIAELKYMANVFSYQDIGGVHDKKNLADEERMLINVSPILGIGSLPFRGYFVPENVSNIIKCYRGIGTITLQAALRYDFGKDEVVRINKALSDIPYHMRPGIDDMKLGKNDTGTQDDENRMAKEQTFLMQKQEIEELIKMFSEKYIISFGKLIYVLPFFTWLVPERRDRVLEKSNDPYGDDDAYGRSIPSIDKLVKYMGHDVFTYKELMTACDNISGKIPRAIKYTAVMYSIGLPPEIVGTGRALKELSKRNDSYKGITDYYPFLYNDLLFAREFLCDSKDMANFFKMIDGIFVARLKHVKDTVENKELNEIYEKGKQNLKDEIKEDIEGVYSFLDSFSKLGDVKIIKPFEALGYEKNEWEILKKKYQRSLHKFIGTFRDHLPAIAEFVLYGKTDEEIINNVKKKLQKELLVMAMIRKSLG